MKNYAFQNVVVYLNGIEVDAFAEGDDVISAGMSVEQVMTSVGADGHMVTSISSDKSGFFKLKLQATSPTNKVLSLLSNAQRAGTSTFVPIVGLIQDLHRQDLVTGTVGVIKKQPDFTRGVKGGDMEWEITFERVDMLLGDPAILSVAALVLS